MKRQKGKASAISDRSGFKFPMNEMVIEPGTNYLVHRSESDGGYSVVCHPLNNLSKYLKGKTGDPFPVKNARPEQEINNVPVNEGSLTLFVQYNTLFRTRPLGARDFNTDDFLAADFN